MNQAYQISLSLMSVFYYLLTARRLGVNHLLPGSKIVGLGDVVLQLHEVLRRQLGLGKTGLGLGLGRQ
ncbi:hypothetical protein BSZ40_10330, partial [Buchananella hordeovulneris]